MKPCSQKVVPGRHGRVGNGAGRSQPGGRLAPAEAERSWRNLYGRIATATGWTYRYIDAELTLPEALELAEYWNECPPTHELVGMGGYMGIGNIETRPRAINIDQCSDQELDVFCRELNGLGV